MTNRRELIGRLGSAALIAGAAAFVSEKPLAADDDDDHCEDGYHKSYACTFDLIDDYKGRCLSITRKCDVSICEKTYWKGGKQCLYYECQEKPSYCCNNYSDCYFQCQSYSYKVWTDLEYDDKQDKCYTHAVTQPNIYKCSDSIWYDKNCTDKCGDLKVACNFAVSSWCCKVDYSYDWHCFRVADNKCR